MIYNITAAAVGAAVFYMTGKYCQAKCGGRDNLLCTLFCMMAGGGASLYCLHRYDGVGACLTAFGFFCILAAVTFTDMYCREIPDRYCMSVVLLAFVSVFTLPGLTVWERLAGCLCVSVPLLVIAVLVPGAFGGGDIKLMASCGLYLGGRITVVSAAVGILLAGGFGICLMLSGRKGAKDAFALGPFLCAGMTAGVIWGECILQWYVSAA